MAERKARNKEAARVRQVDAKSKERVPAYGDAPTYSAANVVGWADAWLPGPLNPVSESGGVHVHVRCP